MKAYYRGVSVNPEDIPNLYRVADILETFAKCVVHDEVDELCEDCEATPIVDAYATSVRRVAYLLENQVPVLMVEDDDSAEAKGDSGAPQP